MTLARRLIDSAGAAGAGSAGGSFLVVADQQTAGRGRLDRRWESAPGSSLLLTVVLDLAEFDAELAAASAGSGLRRPETLRRPDALPMVAPTAGLAMREVLRGRGAAVDLKWPNDLVAAASTGATWADAKLGGLLAEAIWPAATDTPRRSSTGPSASLPTVLVGIGLNLRSSAIPPELSATAVSFEDLVPGTTSNEMDANEMDASEGDASEGDASEGDASEGAGPSRFVLGLLGEFALAYERRLLLLAQRGPSAIREEWIGACCTIGRQVRAVLSVKPETNSAAERELRGRAETIHEDGSLGVRAADGVLHRILVGDVVHLR